MATLSVKTVVSWPAGHRAGSSSSITADLDVSSFKECVKRWAPEKVMKKYQKTSRHEALSDIYDSVEELRFYRQEIMKI